MHVYEVAGAGFNAATDATDDRLYWVRAQTQEQVERAVRDTGGEVLGLAPMVAEDDPDIDFILPNDTLRMGEALLHWAGVERNKNRAVKGA